MLPRHARCVLSRLRCDGHSLLLGSYLSRIGRIENPSCSVCGHSSHDISHLILHCPATESLATLCHSTTSGPDPEEFPGFWGSMVIRHAPIPLKGSGNQQQHSGNKKIVSHLKQYRGYRSESPILHHAQNRRHVSHSCCSVGYPKSKYRQHF